MSPSINNGSAIGSYFYISVGRPSLLPPPFSVSQVVKQQKAECSQKLEGLNVWLAGAASMLANQKACAESGDVDVLQEKQKELKVLKTLQSSLLIFIHKTYRLNKFK